MLVEPTRTTFEAIGNSDAPGSDKNSKAERGQASGSAAVLTTENDRIIQGSAMMAQKLINMQQRVAELSSAL